MTPEQAFAILEPYTRGIGPKHAYYDHVVKYAKQARALVSGQNMDALMRRFNRRESEEAFKQRKDLTVHISKAVCNRLLNPYQKVARSDYERHLRYTNDNESVRTAAFEAFISTFCDGKNVDSWVDERVYLLAATDPNAFVVAEWAGFDNTREFATVYPFEVYSENALYYPKDNAGKIKYLIVEHTVTDDAGKPRTRFTLYGRNQTFTATQLEGAKWSMEAYIPHNLGMVPAVQVGFKKDVATRFNTLLSILDPAFDWLLKMVKANSEMDLSAALHAFPLVIRVAEDCDAPGCNGGTIYDDDGGHRTCGTCKGTGKKRPTSGQEEILVSVPRSAEDVVSLENLYRYVTPPIDILQWQTDYVDRLTEKCESALYASEVFTKSQVSETATKHTIDLQSVYDTLYPFAGHYAFIWEFWVKTIARVTGQDEGLEAWIKFKRDFKLRSYDQLVNDLASGNAANISAPIRRNIQQDIARVMYADEPAQMQKYLIRERFNPFSGMSESQIMFFLTSDLTRRSDKVLYANMGWLFDTLEYEYAANGLNFYNLEDSQMRAKVAEKVALLMSEVTIEPQRLQFDDE